jgi:hypothetical protein
MMDDGARALVVLHVLCVVASCFLLLVACYIIRYSLFVNKLLA